MSSAILVCVVAIIVVLIIGSLLAKGIIKLISIVMLVMMALSILVIGMNMNNIVTWAYRQHDKEMAEKKRMELVE